MIWGCVEFINKVKRQKEAQQTRTMITVCHFWSSHVNIRDKHWSDAIHGINELFLTFKIVSALNTMRLHVNGELSCTKPQTGLSNANSIDFTGDLTGRQDEKGAWKITLKATPVSVGKRNHAQATWALGEGKQRKPFAQL